jgi:YidC/Oxa1 family membrane protein insertase
MDQQRPFLYLTLFFLGFLIWSTWQQEHAPKPIAPVGQTTQTTQGQPNQNSQGNSMPSGSSVSNNADTVPVNTTAVETNVNAKQIHIKTDVLDMMISTEGGTVVQADLPTHSVSLEEKDKATRIIDRAMKYAAQSGLIYRGANGSDLAPSHYSTFSA